ncbi:hypothetical protein IAT40_007964 [Kwoniella sp. CBS 6097]
MDGSLPSASDWFIRLNPLDSSLSPITFSLSQLYITNTSKESKLMVGGGGVIGRKSNSLSPRQGKGEIDSPIVSRQHTQLTITPNGHVYVVDLGSMHGTTIIPTETEEGDLRPTIRCSVHSPIQLLEGDTLIFGKRVISGEIPYEPVQYLVRFRYPKLGEGSRSKGERKELGKITAEKACERFAGINDEARLERVLDHVDSTSTHNVISLVEEDGNVKDSDSDDDSLKVITPPSAQRAITTSPRDIIDLTHEQEDRDESATILGPSKTNTYGVPQAFLYDSDVDDHISQVSSAHYREEGDEDTFTDHEDEEDSDSPPEIMGVRPYVTNPQIMRLVHESFQSVAAESIQDIDSVHYERSPVDSPAHKSQASTDSQYSQSYLHQSPSPEPSPRSFRPVNMESVSSGLGNWFSYSSDVEHAHDRGHDQEEGEDFPNNRDPRDMISLRFENNDQASSSCEITPKRRSSGWSLRTPSRTPPSFRPSNRFKGGETELTSQQTGGIPDLTQDSGTPHDPQWEHDPNEDVSFDGSKTRNRSHDNEASPDLGLEHQSYLGQLSQPTWDEPKSTTQVHVEEADEKHSESESEGEDNEDGGPNIYHDESVSSTGSYSDSIDDEHYSDGENSVSSSYAIDRQSHVYGDSPTHSHSCLPTDGSYGSDEESENRSEEEDGGSGDKRSNLYPRNDSDEGERGDFWKREESYGEESQNEEEDVDVDDQGEAEDMQEEDDMEDDDSMNENDDMDDEEDMNEDRDISEDEAVDEDEEEENDGDEEEENDEDEEKENDEDEEEENDEDEEEEEVSVPLAKPIIPEEVPQVKIESVTSAGAVAAIPTPAIITPTVQAQETKELVKQNKCAQSSIREFCEAKTTNISSDEPGYKEEKASLPSDISIKQEKGAVKDSKQIVSKPLEDRVPVGGDNTTTPPFNKVAQTEFDSQAEPEVSVVHGDAEGEGDSKDQSGDVGIKPIEAESPSLDQAENMSKETDTKASRATDEATNSIQDAGLSMSKGTEVIHPRAPSMSSCSESESEGPITPQSSKKRRLPDDFTIIDSNMGPISASPPCFTAATIASATGVGEGFEAGVERPIKRAKRIGSAFGLLALGAALGSASTIVGLMQLGERQ